MDRGGLSPDWLRSSKSGRQSPLSCMMRSSWPDGAKACRALPSPSRRCTWRREATRSWALHDLTSMCTTGLHRHGTNSSLCFPRFGRWQATHGPGPWRLMPRGRRNDSGFGGRAFYSCGTPARSFAIQLRDSCQVIRGCGTAYSTPTVICDDYPAPRKAPATTAC